MSNDQVHPAGFGIDENPDTVRQPAGGPSLSLPGLLNILYRGRRTILVVTFLGLLAAFALVAIGQPQPGLLFAGMGLMALAHVLRLVCAGYLDKDEKLVTCGPFGWCRNPLYIANLNATGASVQVVSSSQVSQDGVGHGYGNPDFQPGCPQRIGPAGDGAPFGAAGPALEPGAIGEGLAAPRFVRLGDALAKAVSKGFVEGLRPAQDAALAETETAPIGGADREGVLSARRRLSQGRGSFGPGHLENSLGIIN